MTENLTQDAARFWRELLAAVTREVDNGEYARPWRGTENAPGHDHAVPGIWDGDNGPKAGTACAWCMTWNRARAALADPARDAADDAPYQVTVDVRDLFAYLRAAWREGQHYDREDMPDQADSWSASSDYANRTIERWTSMTPATAAGSVLLMQFAGLVLKAHRNDGYPGDVDGDALQAYAERCGLIERRNVDAPCSEGCACADVAEFPTVCFFNTDIGKGAIAAARALEGEQCKP